MLDIGDRIYKIEIQIANIKNKRDGGLNNGKNTQIVSERRRYDISYNLAYCIAWYVLGDVEKEYLLSLIKDLSGIFFVEVLVFA